MPVDYSLYARQIALPELGPEGQERLAQIAVDLSKLPLEAAILYFRAGGLSGTHGISLADLAFAVDAPAERVGVGALAAVEAARRALGEAPRGLPEALRGRLLP